MPLQVKLSGCPNVAYATFATIASFFIAPLTVGHDGDVVDSGGNCTQICS
jgi:hypothetical protein